MMVKTLLVSSLKPSPHRICEGGFGFRIQDFANGHESCFLKYGKHADSGLGLAVSLHRRAVYTVLCSLPSSTFAFSVPPKSKAGLEKAEPPLQELNKVRTVRVKFQLQKECLFGEQFLIVGDAPKFGSWDPSNAVALEWSDGHVWTVELDDVPICEHIRFKFILRGSNGDVLWQPGPDRIVRTWDTNKSITVIEDWENLEVQKIIEEDRAPEQNGSVIDSDIMIIAENSTYPEKVEMPEYVTTSEPKPIKAIIADNISYPNKQPAADPESEGAIGVNPILGTTRNSTLVGPKARNITVTSEGEDPVLVPGLVPLSVTPDKRSPESEDDKRSIFLDKSVGAVDETGDSNGEEDAAVMLFKNGDWTEHEQKDELHLPKGQRSPPDLLGSNNNVVQNASPWGQRILQRL